MRPYEKPSETCMLTFISGRVRCLGILPFKKNPRTTHQIQANFFAFKVDDHHPYLS